MAYTLHTNRIIHKNQISKMLCDGKSKQNTVSNTIKTTHNFWSKNYLTFIYINIIYIRGHALFTLSDFYLCTYEKYKNLDDITVRVKCKQIHIYF